MKKNLSILVLFAVAAVASVLAQTVYVGPDQIPIQETNFGYSSYYKALRLGVNQPARSLALNVDPALVPGGNFTGAGQILVGNSGILAPNQAGSDWIGVLRAVNDRVFLGGPLSSGDLYGGGITVLGGSGDVGVGTITPRSKLDIAGAVSVTDEVGLPSVGRGVELTYQTSADRGRLISYDRTQSLYKILNLNDAMFVTGSGGKIGIATASPSAILDVRRWDDTDGEVIAFGSQTYYMGRLGEDPTANKVFIANTYNSDNTFIDFRLKGSAPANSKMVIRGDGNVGIGTTSPNEKLSVNGRIRAREVIVETTNWSDYVFAKEYKLAPLSEVEQHIERQGHLPGVPSAQEVAAKGVSVGDMQAILLAKIEELTLRQIQQEKRLNDQQAEIAALKTENTKLNKTL
ncbi:MAG: hypothetical protein QM715_08275 [Nibricoccus sp.]